MLIGTRNSHRLFSVVALVTYFAPGLARAQVRPFGPGRPLSRRVIRFQTSSTFAQTITAPRGARRAVLRIWGAGGGAGGGGDASAGGPGGAGGYVAVTYTLSGNATLQLTVYVGQGGGGGARSSGAAGRGGGGGDRTLILLPGGGDVIRVGGGAGGGGGNASVGGGAGGAGGPNGLDGSPVCVTSGQCAGAGRGATSGGSGGSPGDDHLFCPVGTRSSGSGSTNAGGDGGSCIQTAGAAFTAGNGRSYFDTNVTSFCGAGAGGNGYPGGGAAGVESSSAMGCAGGGGGANGLPTTANLTVAANASGNGGQAARSTDPDFLREAIAPSAGGIAVVGGNGSNGGHGLVVIYWY